MKPCSVKIYPLYGENIPGFPYEIPSIVHYVPAEQRSDAAVVIFPGGGYSHRAPHEGNGYTEFLAKDKLKVGDIVLLRGLDSTRTDAKDSYLVALYQGDKFLIQTYHYGSYSMTYDEFVEFFYNRQLKRTEVVA
jgi:hypothetical protein